MMTIASAGSFLRRGAVGAVAFITSASAGCEGGHDCTLVGCYSGLEIWVQPAPTTRYFVELVTATGRVRRTCEAEPVVRCQGRAFFEDYRAAQAMVEVLIGSDTTRRTITGIRYDKSQPNGEGCDPTCYYARATVALTQ